MLRFILTHMGEDWTVLNIFYVGPTVFLRNNIT